MQLEKITITVAEAERRGWKVLPRTSKHRYAFTLPRDRRHARELKDLLCVPSLDYPPSGSTMNLQLRLC